MSTFQNASLSLWMATGRIDSPSDEAADFSSLPPEPVTHFFERAAFDATLSPEGREQLSKSGLGAADWGDELGSRKAPADVQHADGVEVERRGDQVWRYVYKDGALVESSVQDPALPGGRMHFDRDGNELEA